MTDASAAIYDFSAITELAISPELIRELVDPDPAMPDATRVPPSQAFTADPSLRRSRFTHFA